MLEGMAGVLELILNFHLGTVLQQMWFFGTRGVLEIKKNPGILELTIVIFLIAMVLDLWRGFG